MPSLWSRVVTRPLERCLPATLFGRLALLLMGAVLASHIMALTLLFEVLPRPPKPPGPPRPPGIAAQAFALGPGAPDHFGAGAPPHPPPRPPPHPLSADHWPGLLVDVGVRLGVLLLAAWVGARWLSRPLQQLAQAAHALGNDVDRPPMTETGTAECREATRVFNQMQQRIRQQMAERDRFLAAVSHDLRTPLTRMRLRLEGLDESPPRQGLARDVTEMQTLIDATLAYLSGQASTEALALVDVPALLHSLADDGVASGQQVDVSGEAQPCWVQPVALRRCLDNLVGNAVTYGVRAWVRCHDTATELVVEVQDAGPGLPEAELAKVTQPFYRLEPSRHKALGGVGLGLSIAQDVARRHGGTLVLSNVAGGGLLATLRLPRTPGGDQPAARPQAVT